MTFIADLHIHSKYSRACSQKLTLPNINAWCQIKGIDLVGTGDFTHPAWFKDISSQLEQADIGIYKLRFEVAKDSRFFAPKSCKKEIRFILTTEISLIYKKNGKCRKIHYVVLAPDLAAVSKINKKLEKIGNLHSDGRPILGMTSEELAEVLLGISPDIQIIPAHVWTPYFAIFGSKSGFDSVEECFDGLSGHICALETGLSSDPPMNWRLSKNDKYALISNSDAHSLGKLGREATLFDADCDYASLLHVLRNDHSKIAGTIEFFPEEGKYHCDGIKSDKLCLMPEETKKYNYGKNITIGVLHRIHDLADRKAGKRPRAGRKYWHLIPLAEILSEIMNVGVSSAAVFRKYFNVISLLGPELYILKDAPILEIQKIDRTLASAISRMRNEQVKIKPGYDGVYGSIKLF